MKHSFLKTVRHELTTRRMFLISLVVTFCYLLFVLFMPNRRLLTHTLFGRYPIGYKSSLLLALLEGGFIQMHPTDMLFVALTAVLLGINIALFLKEFGKLTNQGRVSMTVGGSMFLGIASTGCSSCGFSLLSLLGVSVSFGFLPFGDVFLRSVVLVLLLGSIAYLLVKIHEQTACSLPLDKPRQNKNK